MTTPIKIKRSGTASSTPSSLDHGELAINYADSTLFWKDDANVIKSFVFQAYASATHASTHATGGSDALTPGDIGAAALSGATFTGAVEFDRTVANSVATAVVVDGNFETTSNAEVVTKGVFSDVRKTVSTGVTDSGKLFGGQFDATADGAGTLAEAYGVYARAVNLGEGNLTTATAIYAHVIGGTTGYGVYIAAGSAATSWGVYQAGTEKNYFGGNVGIGVSPTSALNVSGNATFEASSGVPVTITNTGTGNSFVVNDASGDTTPFVIDDSGRVGIGNSSPSADLEIGSSSNIATRTLVVRRGTVPAYLSNTLEQPGEVIASATLSCNTSETSSGGSLTWSAISNSLFGTSAVRVVATNLGSHVAFFTGAVNTAPTERARIDADGLDVSGVITVSATSGSAGSYAPSLTISGDANTGFGQVSGQSDTASVFTAGHERVRVTSAGAVGIGTSSIDAGVTLDTRGTIQAKAAGVKIQAVDSSVIVKTQASNSTSEGIVGTESNHNLAIRANNVAALRVKTTGALRFVPLSADPASGEAGDVYYNSSTNKLRVYNGTSWVDLH